MVCGPFWLVEHTLCQPTVQAPASNGVNNCPATESELDEHLQYYEMPKAETAPKNADCFGARARIWRTVADFSNH